MKDACEGKARRHAKGVSPQASRWEDIKRRYVGQTLQNAQTLRHNQTEFHGFRIKTLRNDGEGVKAGFQKKL